MNDFTISKNTLKMMDDCMENLRKGEVSDPINDELERYCKLKTDIAKMDLTKLSDEQRELFKDK